MTMISETRDDFFTRERTVPNVSPSFKAGIITVTIAFTFFVKISSDNPGQEFPGLAGFPTIGRNNQEITILHQNNTSCRKSFKQIVTGSGPGAYQASAGALLPTVSNVTLRKKSTSI
jgi:hypothetical protein